MIGEKLKDAIMEVVIWSLFAGFLYGCQYGVWRLAGSPTVICEDDEGHENPACYPQRW